MCCQNSLTKCIEIVLVRVRIVAKAAHILHAAKHLKRLRIAMTCGKKLNAATRREREGERVRRIRLLDAYKCMRVFA